VAPNSDLTHPTPDERAEAKDHSLWRSRFLTLAICGLVPGIAGVADWLVPCSGHADPDFYATCAQVGPVLALTLYVEIIVVMAPVLASADCTQAERNGARALLRANTGLFVISEGVALYAVGSRGSSLFAIVCVLLPWLLQLLLIVDTAYYRAGINKIGRRRTV
jgi:hypothetical protein